MPPADHSQPDADTSLPTLPSWVLGEPRPSVPEQVGPFRVEEKLGAGGAGEVWAAYDPSLDRRIALKLVRRASVGHVQEARLLREAHALAELSHPNIVTVHDAASTEDYVYIAMELVRGGTLKDAFADEAIETQARVDLLLQAARGLEAAHDRGLVHRDFKPANALLGEDGRVRVADFGLARRTLDETQPTLGGDTPSIAFDPFSDLTITGAILGTPAYMSPEQRLGQAVTAASDQFSFCVVAWQALYGVHPLADLDLAAWVAGDTRLSPPPPHPDLPASLAVALRRGLHPDPTRRHPSMAPLLRALESIGKARRRWPRLLALSLATAGLGAVALRNDTPASCPAQHLDWAAPRIAQTSSHRTGDGPLSRAAAVLHTTAEQWHAETKSSCTAESPPPCQAQRKAAFLEARRLLLTPAGQHHAADIVDALTRPCAPIRPNADGSALAPLWPRLAAGDAQGVLTVALSLEHASSREAGQGIAQAWYHAELLHIRGEAEAALGETTHAQDTLRAAYNHAERAGATLLAARLAARLASLHIQRGQTETGEVWLETATSLQPLPARVQAEVDLVRGTLHATRSAWLPAARAFERAAQPLEASQLSDHPTRARLLAAEALARAGEPDKAQEFAAQAVQDRLRRYGPSHPKTANARTRAASLHPGPAQTSSLR